MRPKHVDQVHRAANEEPSQPLSWPLLKTVGIRVNLVISPFAATVEPQTRHRHDDVGGTLVPLTAREREGERETPFATPPELRCLRLQFLAPATSLSLSLGSDKAET